MLQTPDEKIGYEYAKTDDKIWKVHVVAACIMVFTGTLIVLPASAQEEEARKALI